jgi:hypothetical protein
LGDSGFLLEVLQFVAGRDDCLAVKELKLFAVIGVTDLRGSSYNLGMSAEPSDQIFKAIGDGFDLEALRGKFFLRSIEIPGGLVSDVADVGIGHSVSVPENGVLSQF